MRLFLDTSGEISPKNIAKYKGQALSRISPHTRKAISTTIKQVHTQLQYYQDIQTKLRMS